MTEEVNKNNAKRCKNVTEWGRSKSKRLRNEGKAYVSQGKSKKFIPARVVGPPCKDGCFDKLGEDNINEIFSNYWKSSDYNIQTSYLQNCVDTVDIKRRRTEAVTSRKKTNYKYHVLAKNTVVVVCPVAFRSLHGITENRVRSALKKITPTGTAIRDKRGKRPNPHAISFERKQIVIEHINKFSTTDGSYSLKNDPERKNLSELNICKLYLLYREWSKVEYPDIECVSEHYYRDTFRECLNLMFDVPKSEICHKCDEYNIKLLDHTQDNEKLCLKIRWSKDVKQEFTEEDLAMDNKTEEKINEDPMMANFIKCEEDMEDAKVFTEDGICEFN